MGNPVAIITTLRSSDSAKSVWRATELKMWCPGCDQVHHATINVEGDWFRSDGSRAPVWIWDQNLERPTLSPSLLCYSSVHRCPEPHQEVCPDYEHCDQNGHLVLNWSPGEPEPEHREYGHMLPHTVEPAWGNCHSFVRGGRWQFLGDCAHKLAGQTVDMVPLPDWVIKMYGGAK